MPAMAGKSQRMVLDEKVVPVKVPNPVFAVVVPPNADPSPQNKEEEPKLLIARVSPSD